MGRCAKKSRLKKKGTARHMQMKVDVGQRRARTHTEWYRQMKVDVGLHRARTAEPESRAHPLVQAGKCYCGSAACAHRRIKVQCS